MRTAQLFSALGMLLFATAAQQPTVTATATPAAARTIVGRWGDTEHAQHHSQGTIFQFLADGTVYRTFAMMRDAVYAKRATGYQVLSVKNEPPTPIFNVQMDGADRLVMKKIPSGETQPLVRDGNACASDNIVGFWKYDLNALSTAPSSTSPSASEKERQYLARYHYVFLPDGRALDRFTLFTQTGRYQISGSSIVMDFAAVGKLPKETIAEAYRVDGDSLVLTAQSADRTKQDMTFKREDC